MSTERIRLPGAARQGESRTSRWRLPGLTRGIIYVILLLYCVTSIGGIVWVLLTSLKTPQQFISTPPWSLPDPVILANYGHAWETARIGAYFQNSAVVAIISTAASVVLSSMAAYALSRINSKANAPLLAIFLMGLMVPPILTVFPIYSLFSTLGLLSTLHGLILVYTAQLLPFNIFVLTGFFRTLPADLEEAAAVEGSSPLWTFARIMFPLAAPGLTAVAVLAFLRTWNEFFFALVLIQDKSAYTLPLGLVILSQQASFAGSWTPIFAGLVITMIPVLVIFALFQRRVTEGLTMGALK